MISWLAVLLTVIISAGMVVANRKNIFKVEEDKYGDRDVSFTAAIVKPIIFFIFGILVSIFQPYALERVDAGGVGLKVKLSGDERGISDYQYKTGWVPVNTWTEKLYEFPTYQQHIDYDNQSVITKGGFEAFIKPTFNYSIKSESVANMFQSLRVGVKEVEQGWLKNAIVGAVNDVANKWTVDDIFNNREKFEGAIIAECNKRVSKWFIVSQLRTNIVPPDAIKDAINKKTQNIQLAQGELQKAIMADAQTQVKIANAKGDSAQRVITAKGIAEAAIIAAVGEAEAMKKKQVNLSPLYIEYLRVSTWNGQYPTVVGGNGMIPMINMK